MDRTSALASTCLLFSTSSHCCLSSGSTTARRRFFFPPCSTFSLNCVVLPQITVKPQSWLKPHPFVLYIALQTLHFVGLNDITTYDLPPQNTSVFPVNFLFSAIFFFFLRFRLMCSFLCAALLIASTPSLCCDSLMIQWPWCCCLQLWTFSSTVTGPWVAAFIGKCIFFFLHDTTLKHTFSFFFYATRWMCFSCFAAISPEFPSCNEVWNYNSVLPLPLTV